jgi:anti-sigma regulatory factor (Ser/Thr protein kinase)
VTVDPPISQPPAPAAGTGQDAAAGPGPLLLEEEFGGGPLYSLRQAVAAHAAAAGMLAARARDMTIALQELAANAVRHGAGRGRLRMWSRDGALVCQVQDTGPEPRDGRAAARDGADADGNAAGGWPCVHGHGLWLARQVADEMSVVSGPGATCATVVFALG